MHLSVLLHATPSPLAISPNGPRMGWADPDWKWGFAQGAAHDAAKKVRAALSSQDARQAFLFNVFAGQADIEEVKMVLALKAQHARNFQYDQRDWEGLMDDMAACKFEGSDGLGQLCRALRERLEEPPPETGTALADPFPILAASALTDLDLVDKGL
mmetsp:Transcript_16977/g.28315  ORF Transcript_16977/g.28315 Transcript_16977/m.28315 type:complete len:157 (+) Transcript_16977:149-619(+)|eukprot:CAMPEP_0119300322 /NCGR_PEP_ID=MMETSP1333-20130426/2275_1 /TAXON_ID=418940 /ORGANISM="Scyphosphaera apsteinii, Strain RCC1455" /LENGTH=156 /DNA_ID=CAMNT_0007302045 /DNA_START=198 /DNA_END=668 /DNA_ORIENTATION=-